MDIVFITAIGCNGIISFFAPDNGRLFIASQLIILSCALYFVYQLDYVLIFKSDIRTELYILYPTQRVFKVVINKYESFVFNIKYIQITTVTVKSKMSIRCVIVEYYRILITRIALTVIADIYITAAFLYLVCIAARTCIVGGDVLAMRRLYNYFIFHNVPVAVLCHEILYLLKGFISCIYCHKYFVHTLEYLTRLSDSYFHKYISLESIRSVFQTIYKSVTVNHSFSIDEMKLISLGICSKILIVLLCHNYGSLLIKILAYILSADTYISCFLVFFIFVVILFKTIYIFQYIKWIFKCVVHTVYKPCVLISLIRDSRIIGKFLARSQRIDYTFNYRHRTFNICFCIIIFIGICCRKSRYCAAHCQRQRQHGCNYSFRLFHVEKPP